MNGEHNPLHLLQQVHSGALAPEDALLQLKLAPFEDLGYAKIDSHRPIRQGAAEVLYGAGKTPEQLLGILTAMARQGSDPEYGARPLRRYLREELENPAAEALLSGALSPGATLSVDGADPHLKLDIRPAPPVPLAPAQPGGVPGPA